MIGRDWLGIAEWLNECSATPRLETGESAKPERSTWMGGGRGRILSLDDAEYHEQPPSGRTAAQLKLRDRMEQVSTHVPEKYRDLLNEYYEQGLTYEEIGEKRGITKQAIAAQMKTAHKHFVRALAEHGQEVE